MGCGESKRDKTDIVANNRIPGPNKATTNLAQVKVNTFKEAETIEEVKFKGS
jgi:hypothetical protein